MAAAAISSKQPAEQWDDEIESLFAHGLQLPPAAQAAVCDVLDSFLAVGALDARQARRAMTLRETLSAAPGLGRAA